MLTFSFLILEDFWVFLSFLSDRSVSIPSENVLKIQRSLGKEKKIPKSSVLSTQKKITYTEKLVGGMKFQKYDIFFANLSLIRMNV